MNEKISEIYFFLLFSLIPISIIVGPAASLMNIILIDFSFIILILYKKNFEFLSNGTIKLILLLCLYLIFNSIISKNFSIGAARNFGFIRFAILFIAFNYFFHNKVFFNKIMIVWTITLISLSVDTYIESYFGTNIFGYGEKYGSRIVSFFKDEPVVGGYINGFYLVIIGYLFNFRKNFSSKYRYIILFLSLFFLMSILLTGERSNTIKAFLGFFTFYFFNDLFKLKEKIFSILLIVFMLVFILSKSPFLEVRYNKQFLQPIIYLLKSDEEKKNIEIDVQHRSYKTNTYYKLYRSGLSVFKNYPIFGVGNKNYRVETCGEKANPAGIRPFLYECNTHTHQVYTEFLAEHGLIGTMILFYILFNLIFSKIKVILTSKNYVQVGSLIFLVSVFIPLLPTGAFFGDFNLTIFWLNLSLMHSINKKTNIFSKPNI